jgi:hypothetical protein
MAAILPDDDNPALSASIKPTLSVRTFADFEDLFPVLPSGSLRIGGDAPDGLVLVGTAPAAREVRLFDRETSVLVATTTSASDGTYAFTGLSARTEGYDVVIRGVIASGERDDIIPGVQPG